MGASTAAGTRPLDRYRHRRRPGARHAAARRCRAQPGAHGCRAGAGRAHRQHPGGTWLCRRCHRHSQVAGSHLMPTDKQTAALARARSFLFVPGNRPERFTKALASGADAIVLDLEDAVPADEKATARAAIAAAWPDLRQAAIPVVVRMNPPALDCGREDLQLLASLDAPAAVMVPKAESGEDLAGVRSALPATALLPLIERAAGYTALATVAGAAGVLRLVLGDLDFMADTGLQCSADAIELAPLRFAIAISTRTNQLAPAVEGVTADFRNDD